MAAISNDESLDESHAAKAAAASEKIVIAIHGIGDQFRNATIQTVVTAFGRFFDYPAATPLGRFSSADRSVSRFKLPAPAPGSQELPLQLSEIGFFEIYWADLPRRVRRLGYIIEESKAWARTIVERVRARYGEVASLPNARPALTQNDFLAVADVIQEMIETIAVLGNLLWVAGKAGIFKFDLAAMLPAYLGTVQLVGDFPYYREQILKRFLGQLDFIENEYNDNVDKALQGGGEIPDAPKIYIVAHSEGTVVALMGMLRAMRSDPLNARPPKWVHWIRGFMTIGSPIDKHLVLWPDIWEPLQTPDPGFVPSQGEKIQWRNYYDFGDPVGFDLDTARKWMQAHGWRSIFQFEGPEDASEPGFQGNNDYGFSRYVLPGVAHNGYWADEGVFGHFLTTVMGLDAVRREGTIPQNGYNDPPPSRRLFSIASNVIPYVLALSLLYIGVYLLHQGMSVFLKTPKDSIKDFIFNLTGITLLLTGVTVAARMPRLTRAWAWEWIAASVFVIGAVGYSWMVDAEWRRAIGFLPDPTSFEKPHSISTLFPAMLPTLITIGLALAVTLYARLAGRRKRTRRSERPVEDWLLGGMKPLMFPGGLAVLAIVVFRIFNPQTSGTGSLWPLLLAFAGFMYLWWLAALLFDLVFVWHRYIRYSVADQHLEIFRSQMATPRTQ